MPMKAIDHRNSRFRMAVLPFVFCLLTMTVDLHFCSQAVLPLGSYKPQFYLH